MISLALDVSKNYVDQIGNELISLNASSISIVDKNTNTKDERPIYGEDPKDQERFWENNMITALFNNDAEIIKILSMLHSKFNLDIDKIKVQIQEDKDWIKETQSQFKPIKVNKKIWIIPSWHKVQDSNAINIHLDPGLAFGTGSHPTTRLCLDLMSSLNLQNMSCLDFGCGSGILSIVAKKFGSDKTVGVDIDPQAIIASKENAKKNNEFDIKFIDTKISIDEKFDIIVANILSSALKVLAPIISSKCKNNGKIILSGILKNQETEIINEYKNDFTFEKSRYQDNWVCMVAKKNS